MSKAELYQALTKQLQSLLHQERDLVANAANLAALLFGQLPEINWAGVYLLKQGQLVLGPFQGKPACTRMALGRGVCGTSAARREAIVVPDVDQFPGHIACDGRSRSEIVVPLLQQGRLIGVLDVDSPRPGRFDAADQAGLQQLVEVFLERTDCEGVG